MSKQTQKGTSFESLVVGYLAERTGQPIERRAKHGTNDMGDVANVYIGGKATVLECKNHRRMELSTWMGEAEVERGNAGAEYGLVVHKRPGAGAKNAGKNYVTTDLETLAALIVGGRENLRGSHGQPHRT